MANRMFNQFQGSLEKGVVQLFAELTFTGGTPALARGKGIASVSKLGTGVFTITLQDSYVALLNMSVCVTTVGGVLAAAPIVQNRFTTDVTAATPIVNLGCYSLAGALTDPANVDRLFVALTLSNSTAL
jgi:hypothetical protein